jgi:5-methylcytosine-specific restriction endonuclease McrA
VSKFGGAKDRQWRIQVIKKRDGMRCWLCGERFGKREPVTLDHAIPKARGGTNHIHNLRLAHEKCNTERGAIESARAVPIKAATTRCMGFPRITQLADA